MDDKKPEKITIEKLTKMTPEARMELFARGEIKLKVPMRSRDKEINVLHYDFTQLTNRDILKVLDLGGDSGTQLTATQALRMFEVMADRVERPISGLDGKDISEQISAVDVISCIACARIFFAYAYGAAVGSITRQ